MVFALGALLMTWDFIVKRRPLFLPAVERLIFRTPLAVQPGSEAAE